MNYTIKLRPIAKKDILEIIRYYNDQKNNLGSKFFNNLITSLKLLKSAPKIYQIRYKKIRQAPIKKFPIRVHYLLNEPKKEVIILAILHTSRNPEIWKKRD